MYYYSSFSSIPVIEHHGPRRVVCEGAGGPQTEALPRDGRLFPVRLPATVKAICPCAATTDLLLHLALVGVVVDFELSPHVPEVWVAGLCSAMVARERALELEEPVSGYARAHNEDRAPFEASFYLAKGAAVAAPSKELVCITGALRPV